MNFKQDIIDYIKGEFDYFEVNYSPSDDIENDLLKLFTIQKKYIFQFRRAIEVSKELQAKIDQNDKFRNEILEIKRMLERGLNVNPQQSKNLFNYHVHDDLVYDWKIYHLHLSFQKQGNEYFNKRTKDVLFVYITKERALLLDVLKHPPHDIFANKKLLEIIDNNWSNILSEVKGVVGLSHNLNQQERFKLRKYNINEGVIEVNGKFVYSPGLGQTASGHSSEDVMKLNALHRWLDQNEEAILNNREVIDNMFMKSHDLKTPPSYKIIFTEQGPQILDMKTKTCLVKYHEVISLTSKKPS